MRRILIAALGMALVGLQYRLWFGDGGIHEISRLTTAIAAQKMEIEQFRERNRALDAEVRDLKDGTKSIEERARSELGMIRRDEVFYRIVR